MPPLSLTIRLNVGFGTLNVLLHSRSVTSTPWTMTQSSPTDSLSTVVTRDPRPHGTICCVSLLESLAFDGVPSVFERRASGRLIIVERSSYCLEVLLMCSSMSMIADSIRGTGALSRYVQVRLFSLQKLQGLPSSHFSFRWRHCSQSFNILRLQSCTRLQQTYLCGPSHFTNSTSWRC
jgi:transposase-like protein